MFKKLLYWILGIIGGLYVLFLILPFLLIPVFDRVNTFVSGEIEKSTGFKTELKNFRIVTTPKLTAGAKLENMKVYQPDKKLLLDADNMQVKMSLIPLLFRRIEIDVISADKVDLNLYIKKDGHLLIEDFFAEDKKQEDTPNKDKSNQEFKIPFGLKFSNHLPDLRIFASNIYFNEINSNKQHQFIILDTKITDFIFNKKIKISSNGEFYLDKHKVFSYNVKILNKIMPDFDINELLNAQEEQQTDKKNQNNADFNVLEAFKVIKNGGITANLDTKIKIEGPPEDVHLYGNLNVDKISMLVNGVKLPESNISAKFNKNAVDINSDLYTAQAENTKITGQIKTGNNPNIDLNCRSNATLKSVFDIANTFAKIVGINDLETLKAHGKLDADFNIKSDFKKLVSNGYLKLTEGSVFYGLYNVKIDNLVSDIALANNNLLINKLGFSTMGVPFNITGKVKEDAAADININTTSLPIKGLLLSLGQGAILKENPISSGTISVAAKVSGKLIAPLISGSVDINNLNLKNIPSDITLYVNPVNIKLHSTKTGFNGTINSGEIKLINPAMKVVVYPKEAAINEKNITIYDRKAAIEKNEVILSGIISDYMTNKVGLDFKTKGQLNSTLTGTINPQKMLLDLKYSIPSDSVIVIPGFDKSKLVTNGHLNITGAMANPILKGQFIVPSLEIPEIPVSMKNIATSINGPILNGNATVFDFKSGGIVASNIATDYKLLGNDLYLNNLQGKAFDGDFTGNIVYNLSNAKCKVKFAGKNMNALKAIEGSAGIKNALTGTLDFNADVALKVLDYDDMIKSLTGNADFEIKKGYLANLGSLNKFLMAQNISKYVVLKAAGQSASNSSAVKNASQFDYIKGKMTFLNAYANLSPVELSGPLMAYYITGKYQILNGSTNVVILGRLSESVVSTLGSIGSLAVNKLASSIPVLGDLTSSIVKSMNESPKNVDTSKIPSLTSKDTKYKDFKVIFNGGIESASSIKSFKWINDVDTSALDSSSTNTILDTAKITKEQINQTKETLKNAVTNIKSMSKEEAKTYAKEQAKDLLKTFLVPSPSSSSEE